MFDIGQIDSSQAVGVGVAAVVLEDDSDRTMTDMRAAKARLEAAIFEPETLANSLHMAGEDLGFDHFCLVHSNIKDLQVVAADHSLAALEAYDAGGWVATDYRAATVNLFPASRLYLDHVVVPEDRRLSSGVYHDLYVPQKMAYFAGWSVGLADQSWIFSLARSEERGPVSSDEAAILTQLMPHASHTLTFAKRFRDARAQSINDFATRLGIPLIMLGSDGSAIAVTPQAELTFCAEFGLRNGRLWAADVASNNSLDALTQLARRSTLPDLIDNVAIVRSIGRGPLLLRPIAVRGLGLDVLPGARLFITVTDLSQTPAAPEQDLRMLFGLSPAEASVAALLASGRDVERVAAERQTSVATVRTQIRQVFQKMDVSRIGEMVSVVANVTRLNDDSDRE